MSEIYLHTNLILRRIMGSVMKKRSFFTDGYHMQSYTLEHMISGMLT